MLIQPLVIGNDPGSQERFNLLSLRLIVIKLVGCGSMSTSMYISSITDSELIIIRDNLMANTSISAPDPAWI